MGIHEHLNMTNLCFAFGSDRYGSLIRYRQNMGYGNGYVCIASPEWSNLDFEDLAKISTELNAGDMEALDAAKTIKESDEIAYGSDYDPVVAMEKCIAHAEQKWFKDG